MCHHVHAYRAPYLEPSSRLPLLQWLRETPYTAAPPDDKAGLEGGDRLVSIPDDQGELVVRATSSGAAALEQVVHVVQDSIYQLALRMV